MCILNVHSLVEKNSRFTVLTMFSREYLIIYKRHTYIVRAYGTLCLGRRRQPRCQNRLGARKALRHIKLAWQCSPCMTRPCRELLGMRQNTRHSGVALLCEGRNVSFGLFMIYFCKDSVLYTDIYYMIDRILCSPFSCPVTVIVMPRHRKVS